MADEPEASEVSPSYEYAPLSSEKSIRLLYLHTAVEYDEIPIRGSLQEFPIDACPEFCALSYTWATEDGDSSLSKELLCNGAVIKITSNCEAALKRLRRPGRDQVLWVDAVCIDQINDAERSLQIGLMRQIYSQAAWVALWVGDVSETVDEASGLPISDLGMDYLHDFAVEIAEMINSGQDPGQGPLYQEFIQDRMAFQHSESAVFTPRVRGLWDVFHRSWWKRLWVIQEVALSKDPTIICGRRAESFHNLKVVIEALIRSEQPVEIMEFNSLFIASTFHQFHVRHMIETGQLSHPLPPGQKALDILNASRNAHASDPRDKIYGILGFFGASGSDPENIFPAPDYKVPAAELYADVSRAIIRDTKSLKVLSSCYGFFKSTVPDLPSWAVAWNDTPMKYFDEDVFNAAGDSSACYEDSADKLLLWIKGITVDTIKIAGELPDSIGYSNEACVELWRYWWKFSSSLESYPTGDTVAGVFKNTLCWGSDLEYRRLNPGEYEETFDAWVAILTTEEDTSTTAKDIFSDKSAFTYSHRVTSITWGRNMGITNKSYLAMIPVTGQEGDEIVIFAGSKLPFLVRTAEGKSKLIGPCYVHGMMDGECFPTEGSAELEGMEWFTLW